MEALILLLQQLAQPLTGTAPLVIRVTSWETTNLLPQSYGVSIADMEGSGTTLDSALQSLLVVVYSRLIRARTATVIPNLIGAAQQYTVVANLGF